MHPQFLLPPCYEAYHRFLAGSYQFDVHDRL